MNTAQLSIKVGQNSNDLLRLVILSRANETKLTLKLRMKSAILFAIDQRI